MTTYQYPSGMQLVQFIGVQCYLLAAPSLQKLSKAEEIDQQKEHIISDSEDTDVTDLDTSFQRYSTTTEKFIYTLIILMNTL